MDVMLRDLDAYATVLSPSWIEDNDVSSDELFETYDGMASALRVSRELLAENPGMWARLLAQGLARDLLADAGKGGA